MLDIEYIKQIDEVLEVEGFYHIDYSTSISIGFKAGSSRKVFINFMESNYTQHVYYPLYLQRVRNAINKKYRTESFFYYRIIQTDDKIMPCKTVDSLEDYLLSEMTEDEALEKSIVLIMDHIKEKV